MRQIYVLKNIWKRTSRKRLKITNSTADKFLEFLQNLRALVIVGKKILEISISAFDCSLTSNCTVSRIYTRGHMRARLAERVSRRHRWRPNLSEKFGSSFICTRQCARYVCTFRTIDIAFISLLSGRGGFYSTDRCAGEFGRAEIKYLSSKRVWVKSSSRKRVMRWCWWSLREAR